MVSTCIVDSSDTLPFEGWSSDGLDSCNEQQCSADDKNGGRRALRGGGAVEVHDSS